MAVTSLGMAIGLSTIPIVAISLKKCVQVNFWAKKGLPGREGRGAQSFGLPIYRICKATDGLCLHNFHYFLGRGLIFF